jgi:hypothetical protein
LKAQVLAYEQAVRCLATSCSQPNIIQNQTTTEPKHAGAGGGGGEAGVLAEPARPREPGRRPTREPQCLGGCQDQAEQAAGRLRRQGPPQGPPVPWRLEGLRCPGPRLRQLSAFASSNASGSLGEAGEHAWCFRGGLLRQPFRLPWAMASLKCKHSVA